MKKEPLFNPTYQSNEVSCKVVHALERISESFRVMLWNEGKDVNISPIQVQILTYLAHFPTSESTVTALSIYFNMTKATISDALKTLELKELVKRKVNPNDTRSYQILLTRSGKSMAKKVEGFAQPLLEVVREIPIDKQAQLLHSSMAMIQGLSEAGILNEQRMCLNCNHYEVKSRTHLCRAKKQKMQTADLLLECAEFE
jgi:DNA-binding MarR family transcriptional regulator